jgi:acyl-CoA synthetase (AMP-forming)/AMP-acid ligase II
MDPAAGLPDGYPEIAHTSRLQVVPALPLAEADGGELVLLERDPRTVTEALLSSPELGPDAGVRVISRDGEVFTPYVHLLERARRVLGGLRARGLRPGAYAILQIGQPEDYFPVLWACLLGGVRCVTVTPPATDDRADPALEKLVNLWRRLGSPLVVTDGAAPAGPADALGIHEGPAGLRALSVHTLERNPPSHDIHPAAPADVLLLQLSAGSTGRSRIVQITHRAVIEMAVAFRQRARIAPGDTTFNWLPTDHVGALVMFHLRDVVVGCTGIHAPTAYVAEQPLRWLDVLETYRVAHSWSPNFGYRMLADALREVPNGRWNLSWVKTLLNGGEQCTMPVVRDFLARTAPCGLRADAMVFSWGMAETATGIAFKYACEPGSSVRVRKASLGGVLQLAGASEEDCVEFTTMGAPAPGARFRIAGPGGDVLPERTIGRLQVRSARVTPGYLDAAGENAAAFTGDGWFDTGDLAFLINGELVITGRAKEQIVINGANHYCHEIEDACGQVDGT